MIDHLCRYRHCYQYGLNKGSYTQGVGYTSYYKKPREVCMTNHLHGCPDVIPEPDPELARCCVRPRFARSKTAQTQRCKTCGKKLSGWGLQAAKTLADLPSADCSHKRVERQDVGDGRAQWFCPDCELYWLRPPELHSLGGLTREQRFNALFPWVAKMEKQLEAQNDPDK